MLFRVAAGPRVGFGHLVRAAVLARALGVQPVLSVRGGAAAKRVARRLGCRVAPGGAATALRRERPRVLVVDDPIAEATKAWRGAARRRGVRIASIHDLGIGAGDADLVVDGSVAPSVRPASGSLALLGPRFAVLDPRCGSRSARRAAARPPRHDPAEVLITFGGGSQATAAATLAALLANRRPDVCLRVALGFAARPALFSDRRIVSLTPRDRLAAELRRCRIAITGGGVTLYEACALGVPTVAVAVVPGQRPAIRGFASRGAVIDGGSLSGSTAAAREMRALGRIAARAARLLDDARTCGRLRRAARRIVDGRGAARVAAAIHRLAMTTHRGSPHGR